MNEKPVTNLPHATALVVAAESSEQRRWAIGEVLRLVRELAREQPKVVLVDLLPGEDSLSSVLEVEGGAGIVDVLFRGDSFSTVARRPGTETFFFLPIGHAPPPREVLYKHPGWSKVSSRLANANAYLLPCVSARHWIEAGPIAGFEACVLFNAVGGDIELPEGSEQLAEYRMEPEVPELPAGEAEAPAEPELAGEERVVTAVPLSEPAAEEVTLEGGREIVVGPERVEEPEPAAEPPFVVERDRLGGAEPEAEAGTAVEPPWSSPSIVTPGQPFKPRARRRRVIGPLFAALAVVVLGFTLWEAWRDGFFVRELGLVEDVDREAAATGEQLNAAAGQPEGEEAKPATPPAAAIGEGGGPEKPAGVTEKATGQPVPTPAVPEAALGYSVAIASYPSLEDALAHQERIARADLQVYVAPTPVRGKLWYRVLAGMLETREEAAALLRELVRQGIKREANSWDVRPTRLAFHFGVYPSAGDAQATVETLRGLGIPAYLVPAPMAAGQERAYHVYAGGYRTPEQAEPLGERISRAGLKAELVERAGLAPR